MLQSKAGEVLAVMKDQLAAQLTRSKYELLIRPLEALSFDADVLTLTITNEVLRGWLLDQYGELLTELAELIVGRPVRLSVEVEAPADSGGPLPGGATPTIPGFSPPPDEVRVRRPLLNPRFTFEQFAVGPGNQFAFSAAQQVALRPGTAYNPLLIYGNAGLGKTHLLHAIGHAFFAAQPQANVVYATAEKFTNDYIEHVRTGRMPQLHARYRAADLLLIDDVQFVAGKAETAGELFHTILQLIEAGKQVAVAADKPPRLLKGLDERLASRLSAGLVCDLSAPALETRIAILERKAALEQVSLPADVARFIAERATESVRQLEGALIRLLAFCDFSSSAPSVELASRVLTDLLEGQVSTQLSIQQIMKAAGEHFNVSEQLLLSPNRSKRVALARMVVMYLARQYTNLTLSQIGSELGGRDHSTVSHGAGKIAADIGSDPFVEQAVAQITRVLR